MAVAPEAQGRGLGKSLTLAGLHHLAGVDEVLLYVESDNLPALAMYERLGFSHASDDTHVQYRSTVHGAVGRRIPLLGVTACTGESCT